MNKKGFFITLEGGEGAGKSLLIDLLEKDLLSRSFPVLKTRNPGGTATGEKIREIVLHDKKRKITPRCELLLYLTDRAQHVEEVLLPALEKGMIVLCDRFNDSTIAYQSAGRGIPIDDVRSLCAFAAHGLIPDLTLYLDIDPVIGLERVKKIGQGIDRLESEKLAFHRDVRRAYLQLAEMEKDRISVLDASASPDFVFEQAKKEIDAALSKTAM